MSILLLGLAAPVAGQDDAPEVNDKAQTEFLTYKSVRHLRLDKAPQGCLSLVRDEFERACSPGSVSDSARLFPLSQDVFKPVKDYTDTGFERRQGMVAGAITGALAGSAIAGDDEWEGAVLGALVGGFLGSRKGATPDQRELNEHYRKLEQIRVRGLDNSGMLAPDMDALRRPVQWAPRKPKKK